MRVLVGCEFSGVVRDAFIARGHDAVSCDLLPSERPGPHYQADVREVMGLGFDLAVFHPPCTFLASSGARWWAGREVEQEAALAFVRALMDAPIARIAVENPVGRVGTVIRKADQYFQPWEFGHAESKRTGLWLKGLPRLRATLNVFAQMGALEVAVSNRVHHMSPGPNRWRERSRTLPGVASAMAEQWGALASFPSW